MSLKNAVFSLGALTILLAAAPASGAQQCVTSADCAKGFTCITIAPTPAPLPACQGTNCGKASPPSPAVDAGVATAGVCEEAACATDADCGPTMICHIDNTAGCAVAVACPANADCQPAPGTPPACPSPTSGMCQYKWELPCAADADCGTGFSCSFPVSGGCASSGVASTGTVSGGMTTAVDAGAAPASRSALLPADAGCTTTTSTIGSCTPKATTCQIDGDCPAAWTCVDAPLRGGPLPAQSADGGVGIAVGAPAQVGGASSIAPAPSGTGTASDAGVTKVCESPLGTIPTVGIGGTPLAAGADGAGGTSGTQAGGGSGGGTTSGAKNTADMPMVSGGAASAPSAGCSLAGGAGASSLAAALALLGLVLARRRR